MGDEWNRIRRNELNKSLPWIWLRATGEHDRLELTDQEHITFQAIANRNEDVW